MDILLRPMVSDEDGKEIYRQGAILHEINIFMLNFFHRSSRQDFNYKNKPNPELNGVIIARAR